MDAALQDCLVKIHRPCYSTACLSLDVGKISKDDP